MFGMIENLERKHRRLIVNCSLFIVHCSLFILSHIRHDSHFIFELYVILGRDSLSDEITKCDDILPRSLLIIDEEVPVLFTDLHSADTSSLESRLVDETPR